MEKTKIKLDPIKTCSNCGRNELRHDFSRLIPSLCQDCAEEELVNMLQQIKYLIDELLKNFKENKSS